MKLKIGDWATNIETNETFVILKIADAPIIGTTFEEESYYDLFYDTHITYHCRKATRKEIEKKCLEMLEYE